MKTIIIALAVIAGVFGSAACAVNSLTKLVAEQNAHGRVTAMP